MENGSILRVFVEWEVIAACLVLMLLLPLIFFLASVKRREPRPAQKATARRGPAQRASAQRAPVQRPPAQPEDERSTPAQ